MWRCGRSSVWRWTRRRRHRWSNLRQPCCTETQSCPAMSVTFLRIFSHCSQADRSIVNSINQSIKMYFSSNEKQLQYNKCYSTWKATREALRSLKLVAWTKKPTQILIHQKKRKETGGETDISMCNSSASTNTSTYTINSKSSIHISWLFFITVGHKSTTILTYSERIGMQCY